MELNALIRAIGLAILAVSIWALAKYGDAMPAPLPATAPATQFSAGRAEATLARVLGPEKPHPASTAENQAVRTRILGEFAKLGIRAATYRAMGCNTGHHRPYLACATVTDIVAPVRRGEGKAIVLLAHYDSVPAGPGAADDGSGVATVLETVRALLAKGGPTLHPVIAVLTDGEEYGLLGAASFLDDPAFRKSVGIVVNVEARGSTGPSLLFQTSDKAARLIDLYADNVPDYATSSLFAEIYKYLPNDTDLTLFLDDGIPGFNFAFTGTVADYHTPLDTQANLSPSTLQQHGNNMLGVVSALERTPYQQLAGGNAVYLDVLGRWLPRMPESWALPAAIALLVLLVLAAAIGKGERFGHGEWARAAALFPALVIGAVAIGFLFSLIAQGISGAPDPAYAHPLTLRIALGFGIAAIALLTARLAGTRAAAASVWLWLAVLGVGVAALLPGASPYFLLPVAFAAVLMLATARLGWSSAIGQAALLIPALAALVVWLQLVANGEMLMGLKLHPLFTLPAAVAAAALVPLLMAQTIPARIWQYSVGGCFLAGLIAAILAGFQLAYSATWPQRLNINYVLDAGGKPQWAADAGAPLPASLRKAADFASAPALPFPGAWQPAYLAPAPRAEIRLPTAEILADARDGAIRRVTLGLDGSSDAAMMLLRVPAHAGLKTIDIGQKRIVVPSVWPADQDLLIQCLSADCASMPVTLTMADMGALSLDVIERRAALPAFGASLARARGTTAVPSQFGDGMVLVTRRDVPAVK
jgi:hypothetical protein